MLSNRIQESAAKPKTLRRGVRIQQCFIYYWVIACGVRVRERLNIGLKPSRVVGETKLKYFSILNTPSLHGWNILNSDSFFILRSTCNGERWRFHVHQECDRLTHPTTAQWH
ncbi:hypothetical protein [Nostoc sp.]|uniref:hypothetical protein n=1 Tax=Nostoc sp. TaxID=1180 RepID=UPI002FF9CA5B